MKIRGDELTRFVDEAWPGDDWYWDHDLFDDPVPGETYDTDEIGGVHFQGSGDDPTRGNGYDLGALIRKWRKARDFDLITIEVPKAESERIKLMLQAAGVKVQSP